MRQILLTASALIALAAPAYAQLGSGVVVYDPAAVAKEAETAISAAQTVKNGYQEIQSMAHGNGFASLVPELGGGISANPLGSVGSGGAVSLMSGTNTGGLSGLFSSFLGQTQTYTPQGDDPEAQMLKQRAQAAAGQMSIGQQMLNGASARLSLLPQLFGALTGTADIKDSVDANVRVGAEQATQSQQANQTAALLLYQNAEAAAQRSREELTLRQGADQMVSEAQAAAADAAAGNVTLVHN